jgi:dihydroflavonol-4-reductase
VRAASHWWTYRSAKARRELGWSTQPHEDTVEATVRFWQERLGDRAAAGARQPLPLRLLGSGLRRLPGG